MPDAADTRDPEPRLLTVREVADMFGLSPWTVREMIKHGDLPYVDFGTAKLPNYRVDLVDVRAAIERRKNTRHQP
jgi:excisionase family DNA binding protein